MHTQKKHIHQKYIFRRIKFLKCPWHFSHQSLGVHFPFYTNDNESNHHNKKYLKDYDKQIILFY
jgi:hypothetical protein